MKESKKYEYLNYLLQLLNREMLSYDLNESQKNLIKKLTGRLTDSDDIFRDLYLLTRVRDFRNIGRYLIFVLKKIEENAINFDNLLNNTETDKEFLKKELLGYFSNPVFIKKQEFKETDESSYASGDITEEYTVTNLDEDPEISEEYYQKSKSAEDMENPESDSEAEEIFGSGKYLELIKSEEQSEIVFELPGSDNTGSSPFEIPEEDEIESVISTSSETEYSDLPEESQTEIAETEIDFEELTESADSESSIEESTHTGYSGEKADNENLTEEEPDLNNMFEKGGESSEISDDEELSIEENTDSFRIVSTLSGGQTVSDTGEKKEKEEAETGSDSGHTQGGTTGDTQDRIELSEEIQEELKIFGENTETEEDGFEITEDKSEEQPVTNAEFQEFEREIETKNNLLKNDFDIMIYLEKARPGDEEERNSIIKNIMEISDHLCNVSRKMTLEIISNIYQTIYLSFEKISDGKYDISESTLLLFRNGLDFIVGIIRGENYFEYKAVYKSIENIRNKLLTEKERRLEFHRRLSEKREFEERLSSKYPEDVQKRNLLLLKKQIIDTENKFQMIEKIGGEYRTYEALRSLSACLINLKEIVKLSNELEMKSLSKLSESAYIFIKFLQGYRINPDTEEIKEANRFLIKCMKALYMDKEPEDIEVFISYLNDPVKILTKGESGNSKNIKI